MEKHIEERLVKEMKGILAEAYQLGKNDMWSEIYALKEAILKKEQEKIVSN